MAVEVPLIPRVIEDHPYAVDGRYKRWVESYAEHYYSVNSVASKVELQEWWSEIMNKRYGDSRFSLNSLPSCIVKFGSPSTDSLLE